MLDLYTPLDTLLRNTGFAMILLLGVFYAFPANLITTNQEILSLQEEVCEEPPMRVTYGSVSPLSIIPDNVVVPKKAVVKPLISSFSTISSYEDKKYGFNFDYVINKIQTLRPVIDQMAEDIESPHARAFFKKNALWVLQEGVLNGILPSGKMGQGALESNYGRSGIAINSNNFFCIKSKNKKGYKAKDDEYYCPTTKKRWHGKNGVNKCTDKHTHILEKSTFVIYATPWDSWRSHSTLLRESSRYKKTRLSTDFVNYCYHVGRSGYATDPKYGKKVKSIIQKNLFFRLDEYIFNDAELSAAFKMSQKR